MTISSTLPSQSVASNPILSNDTANPQPVVNSQAVDEAIRQTFARLQKQLDTLETSNASTADAPVTTEPGGQQSPAAAAAPPPTTSVAKPVQTDSTASGLGSVTSGVPGAPDTVPKRTDQPTDPTNSVSDYLDANNGLLRNLGNQEGVKDALKKRYGDWTDPKRTGTERAQSAYNAARHVGIIKHKEKVNGHERSDALVGNGKLEGGTKHGDIRNGTELGDLKNSLKSAPLDTDHSPTRWDAQDKRTDDVLHNPRLALSDDDQVTLSGVNLNNLTFE